MRFEFSSRVVADRSDGLLEKKPRQKAREKKNRVVVGDFARRGFLLDADLEDECPAQQHDQRMDDTP